MDIVRFCYMEIFFMPVCTLTSSVWVPISNIWSNSQIFASRLDAKKKKKFSVVTVLLWMWASFYIESHSCFFPTKIVYWCYLLVFLLYWFFFLVIRSNWSVTFFFFARYKVYGIPVRHCWVRKLALKLRLWVTQSLTIILLTILPLAIKSTQ